MKTGISAVTALVVLVAGCVARHKSSEKTGSATPVTTVPAAEHSAPAAKTNGFDAQVQRAAAQSLVPFEGEGWRVMFNGKDLSGWRETPFAGRGELECREGLMVLGMGDPFTGVNWTNDFPKLNYEVALEAMRLMGTDFFCGLTVPVGEDFCSLIVGGWGGSLVGISSLDGMDASENETMKFVNFERNRWYRIRLRVTPGRIEGWIDDDKLINAVTEGRKVSLRPGEIEESKPFGIACWMTAAAYRNIQWRPVEGPAGKAPRW